MESVDLDPNKRAAEVLGALINTIKSGVLPGKNYGLTIHGAPDKVWLARLRAYGAEIWEDWATRTYQVKYEAPYSPGIEEFSKERSRAISLLAHTVKQDVNDNDDYQLALAVQLIVFTPNEALDPMDRYEMLVKYTGWNPLFCEKVLLKTYKERLVIAGQLLAAEYDRIDYLENHRKHEERS